MHLRHGPTEGGHCLAQRRQVLDLPIRLTTSLLKGVGISQWGSRAIGAVPAMIGLGNQHDRNRAACESVNAPITFA